MLRRMEYSRVLAQSFTPLPPEGAFKVEKLIRYPLNTQKDSGVLSDFCREFFFYVGGIHQTVL